MKGLKIRKEKLKNKYGFYFILAVDHQLSSGYVKNVSETEKWIEFVNNSNNVSAIVLNKGSLDKLPNNFSKIIIPQLVGAPSLFGKISKGQMLSLKKALFYGAEIISVQVNFEEQDYLRQFMEVSEIIEKAHSFGIPVLCMINLKNSNNLTTELFLNYVKICSELGSDFIKINLPNDAIQNKGIINSFLTNSPPVLLAGGSSLDNFTDILKTSKKCGFSGVCIGRNLVNHPNPNKLTDEICDIFQI